MLVEHPVAILGEFGWRGFLLPRLLPIGRLRAYILTGCALGLLYAAIAVSAISRTTTPASAVGRTILFFAVFGVVQGELVRRFDNVTLSGVLFGCLAAHTIGTSASFFYYHTPQLGGPVGFVSLSMWASVAVALRYWPHGNVAD